ncbi:MRPL39 [Cordylochernes scorpioides]|uniref:MRPL39 n=1 Tax=Cordylochernes scorpioides TaxID=51811 RepID=A0ABY6K7N0_9ARAC|nr:MRPL39 [Cordylochernes scorpioides]
MFDAELEKQKLQVPRIEKIEVTYKGKPEPYLLKMNKNISTPLDCTKHMVRTLTLRSALAMVDDEPWDMNRPLKDSCELKLLDFHAVILLCCAQTFWRSCSFLLGKVIDKAFKEDFPVSLLEQLASLPDTVTVYRLGDYCDLSPGPMITQTGLIGRIDTTAIHPVNTPKGLLYRFQGIAIPSQIGLQEAAYRLILKRARKLVSTP